MAPNMILPLKLYTSESSWIVFSITIPLWFSTRNGFRAEHTQKFDQFSVSFGEDADCLHAYCINFRFRVRSNKVMDHVGRDQKRFIYSFDKEWLQVFNSAII